MAKIQLSSHLHFNFRVIKYVFEQKSEKNGNGDEE